MIAKNEEAVLARCLESVQGVFDHIVIVDTGSTDKTRNVAQKYADITADYRWQNDFAAARNYSFSLSTADYIMWLDADDVLLPTDKDALLSLKARLDGSVDAYMLLYRMGEESDGWAENKICACRDLAECYKTSGNRKKRLAALLQSFEYAPPRPEICCALGEYFFEEKDYRQAIFWYKLALNEKADAATGGFVLPDHSGFLPCIWLCVCYDRLGEHEKAAAFNEAAGKFKPQDKSYLQNKAYFENLSKGKKL